MKNFCLLLLILTFGCQSNEEKQYVILTSYYLYEHKCPLNSEGKLIAYNNLIFATVSPRTKDGELWKNESGKILVSGWDWQEKKYYDGEGGILNFDRKDYSDEMDLIMLTEEIKRILCYDNFQVYLNQLKRFCIKNKKYFDDEVLKRVFRMIDS
tara:strand:- start:392 stop:853 length:462 start_codon:yes stop_codon:yes gene_type:complete